MHAAARLCRPAAGISARRQAQLPPLHALAGNLHDAPRRSQASAFSAVAPHSQWQRAVAARDQRFCGGSGSSNIRTIHGSSLQARAFTAEDIQADVGVMVEGQASGLSEAELEALSEVLYRDSIAVVKQAALLLLSEEEEERDEPPGGC